MLNSSRLASVTLIVSALLFTGGVIKKVSHMIDRGDKPQIAVIAQETADLYWQGVRAGALQAAKDLNVKLVYTAPETAGDRERQIQLVDDMLIKGVDAIVLSPNDGNAHIKTVAKVMSRGIPCVLIDAPINGEEFDTYIGTDNIEMGVKAAHELASLIDNEGDVYLMGHIPNILSTDKRAEGFIATIKAKYPKIKILAYKHSTTGSVEEARQNTTDLLMRNKNVVGIFATNRPSVVGALKALTATKLAHKIKFVGCDSDATLALGLEKGEINTLLVQHQYLMGYKGVEDALKLIKGKKVEKFQPTPIIRIVKETLEEAKRLYPYSIGLAK